MTGKTVGKWFVICCEKCKKKKQTIGEVVYEPKEVDKKRERMKKDFKRRQKHETI